MYGKYSKLILNVCVYRSKLRTHTGFFAIRKTNYPKCWCVFRKMRESAKERMKVILSVLSDILRMFSDSMEFSDFQKISAWNDKTQNKICKLCS